jgi:hypothetical protein
MKRRNFLRLTGIAAAAVAAIPGFSLYYASAKDSAVDLILDEYKFLKIDKAEVVKYVDDFFNYHPVEASIPWKMKIKLHHYVNFQTVRSRLLIDGFLPATDFFLNKMDESRPITYLTLYDPHKRPCSNPFSSLYYPPPMAVS